MNKLSTSDLQTLKASARTAAIAAGEHIQSQFDKHYTKEQKVGGDSLASQVVTEVDLKAQEIILQYLQPTLVTYDLGLLTEESVDDHSRLVKDYFWCIDPMDGTLPFTEQRTGYAVSIALISKAGDPVVAVVYIPDLALCYSAIKGMGLSLNDAPLERKVTTGNNTLHFYMDISFQTEKYFDWVKARMEEFVVKSGFDEIEYHDRFGGVRNAISVLSSGIGCYFKFPKESNGCGSIWDYAATRLFFEELQLPISNAAGDILWLNNDQSTFMNDVGILYATNKEISRFIIDLGYSITKKKTFV